jgi:hypothetical protein
MYGGMALRLMRNQTADDARTKDASPAYISAGRTGVALR